MISPIDIATAVVAVDLNGSGGNDIWFEALADILIGASAIIIALTIIFKFFFKTPLKMWAEARQFFEDWNGEPARDGYEERPGMKHRVQSMETVQANIRDSIDTHIIEEKTRLDNIDTKVDDLAAKVEKELTHNGGSSTKDAAHEALKIVRNMAPLIEQIQIQQEEAAVGQDQRHAMYLAALEKIRSERSEVFEGIREMIGASPEDQARIWETLAAPYLVDKDNELPMIQGRKK